MALSTLPKLYLRNALTITIPVSQLGTGKTVTGKICTSAKGDPSAIGSSTGTFTEGASTYALTISRATLNTDLGGMVGHTVAIHVDDGAGWHVSREYTVVDQRGFTE
jgi:hypothetical protein